jgi:hypothetical protein
MSRRTRFLILLSCLLLLFPGCTQSLKIVGFSESLNELLIGEATHNLWTGAGNFTVKALNSNIVCEGGAMIVQVSKPSSCVGQKGEIFGTCSDGRYIKGKYITTSCTRGFGMAIDNLGNQYQFKFGVSEEELNNIVEDYKNKVLKFL